MQIGHKPEEMAGSALFLASDDAHHITGSYLIATADTVNAVKLTEALGRVGAELPQRRDSAERIPGRATSA